MITTFLLMLLAIVALFLYIDTKPVRRVIEESSLGWFFGMCRLLCLDARGDIVLPSLIDLCQREILQREYHDALVENLLFRAEFPREKWEAHVGTTQSFTRNGVIATKTRPRRDLTTEVPASKWSTERWSVQCDEWVDSIDVHMPSSFMAISSNSLNGVHNLGVAAGRTLDRVARQKLFLAYNGGHTMVDGNQAGNTILVLSINGFTHNLYGSTGAEVMTPVSVANPLPVMVTIAGIPTLRNIVAATPLDPLDPTGAGTITFSGAPLIVLDRATVRSTIAPYVHRVGGADSVDGITGTDTPKLQDFLQAKAFMRRNNIPPHPDGTYHCFIDSLSQVDVSMDDKFLQAIRAYPGHPYYGEFAQGVYSGILFIENTAMPRTETVDADDFLATALELSNATGVTINRSIMTGGGVGYEKFVPFEEFIGEAGLNGKVADFAVTNNGVAINTDGIKLIMRAPVNKTQDQSSFTYMFTGGYGIPTDSLTGTPAAYKRACVIEHA